MIVNICGKDFEVYELEKKVKNFEDKYFPANSKKNSELHSVCHQLGLKYFDVMARLYFEIEEPDLDVGYYEFLEFYLDYVREKKKRAD